MSQWTHIAGTIRVDTFYRYSKTRRKIVEILGEPARFGDKSDWEQCPLPIGSEGSIDYKIVKTGKETFSKQNGKKSYGGCDITAYAVVFWGDLRDFDKKDCKKIDKWFYNTIKKIDDYCGVRQATIHVRCNDRFNYVMTMVVEYKPKSDKYLLRVVRSDINNSITHDHQ